MALLDALVVAVLFAAAASPLIAIALNLVSQLGGGEEPDDPFDLAAASVDRLQAGAWRAIEELRAIDQQERKQ